MCKTLIRVLIISFISYSSHSKTLTIELYSSLNTIRGIISSSPLAKSKTIKDHHLLCNFAVLTHP
ncbi:hypothetical protein Lalb_Chr08g0235001 [Lupinus albus]|uniref:Uncharacterized protein n=1 Tax=Lupinus albus TaxID=3870 RepID=A0A6A4Q2P3_LUPAL|nr:hypothetical protein Lalb_Chr08g0235001 [Lupinus albus]